MRFQFIAEYRGDLSRARLCRLMQVSDRGLRAWRHRPPSLCQRRDMILLAHIREQHQLSLGSYGRPRMTQELNELGVQVGQRRVARIMRDNGIQILRIRKFKRTTHCPTGDLRSKSAERGKQSRLQHRTKSLAPGLHGEWTQPQVGG